MSVLEFSWLGDDAATGGVGAVLCGLGDESEGDADTVEFVIAHGGTWDGVDTATIAFAAAAAIDGAGLCGRLCGRSGGSSFRGFENLARGVISVLEFSWLGDDAAAGGGENSMRRQGEERVYKEGGGNGRDM